MGLKPGDMIKVGLPGESLWALVTGITKHGHIVAALRNESVHQGFPWNTQVVLGPDNYTIEEPSDKVAAAQRSVDEFRKEQGWPTPTTLRSLAARLRRLL